jgi:PAS domain S-box-containing protein
MLGTVIKVGGTTAPATSSSPEVYVSDSGSGAPLGSEPPAEDIVSGGPGGAPLAPAGSFAVTDAATLGLSALAGVVAGAQDGIAVLDADGQVVYANPAARELLGCALQELGDRDFEANFVTRELTSVLAASSGDVVGSAPFIATLVSPDGCEHTIVRSSSATLISGRPHVVAIFRDLGVSPAAAHTAATLAQTARELVGNGSIEEILTVIARHAVEATRALACGIAVVGEDGKLRASGGYGQEQSCPRATPEPLTLPAVCAVGQRLPQCPAP